MYRNNKTLELVCKINAALSEGHSDGYDFGEIDYQQASYLFSKLVENCALGMAASRNNTNEFCKWELLLELANEAGRALSRLSDDSRRAGVVPDSVISAIYGIARKIDCDWGYYA